MAYNYHKRMINYCKSKFKFRKITSPQKQFIGIAKKLGLNYQREFHLLSKYYDFYLKDYNILIQVDGTYWHGKGLKNQQRNLIQKKNAANDLLKDRLAKIRQIPLYRIWQGQVTQQAVKKIIEDKLQKDKRILK